jgi:hypothetical protein
MLCPVLSRTAKVTKTNTKKNLVTKSLYDIHHNIRRAPYWELFGVLLGFILL